MSTNTIELSKLSLLAFLVIILISIIIVQVKPESSKATSRIDTMDSDFTEEFPRIEASFISGSGESFISVGGKLFREGDTINGFRFLKVYPDKVEFEKDGKTVVGNIYDTQTSTRSESNYLLQQPVNSEQIRYNSSNDYYKQHKPPAYSKPFVQMNIVESRWRVFETTTIDGKVRKIRKGTIFKTLSKNIYEVAEIIFLFEMEVKPDVTVLTDGQFHKLLIEGVEEPLLCTKLNRGIRNICSVGSVIEALVINELDGLDHGKIFKLDNGQIWEQEEFYIYTGIFIMPKVTIWHNGVVFKMKVDGVDKPVTVYQIY